MVRISRELNPMRLPPLSAGNPARSAGIMRLSLSVVDSAGEQLMRDPFLQGAVGKLVGAGVTQHCVPD